MIQTRIGISGWRYEPWRGVFYPQGLRQDRELEFASRAVNSIEINGSFYSLQTPESYRNWYAATPKDFVFSVKGPRFITHMKRLRGTLAPLGNFFASGVLYLQEKMGPILWQLPPNFLYRPEVLEDFLELLPRDVGSAVKLAANADRREPDYPRSAKASRVLIRHCLEVRHHSFENPEFIDQLRRHNVALVFADTAGKWPYIEDLTADFVYIRLHGEKAIYKSGYNDASLRFWANRIRSWQAGKVVSDQLNLSDTPPRSCKRSVYVYFDNDIKVKAPFDAARLMQMLNLKWQKKSPLVTRGD